MIIDKLSPKQLEVFNFAYSDEEVLICDGAVRSGKTLAMSVAFILWAMENFSNTNFAICGKTVQQAERNILRPLEAVEGLPFVLKYKITNRQLTVRCAGRVNFFYIFGGKDESSYALIQGLTLAGVLFDEVALMPRSFVEQAIARTLSFSNSKIFFNCNPESPTHWFYEEWLASPERSFKHLHFLMNDNPVLGPDEIGRAERMFSGIFYDRYIRGLWVRAEGIIFPEFASDPEPWVIEKEELPDGVRRLEVGFDIGGNGSAYALTATGQGFNGVQYKLKSEKRQAEEMSMDEVEDFVVDFCEEVEERYSRSVEIIRTDHVDVVRNTLNDHTRFRAKFAVKPPLEDRLFLYSKLFNKHKVKFVRGQCDALIDELRNLIFDPKSERAIPLDDGSMQIDAWDSNIYSESSYFNFIDI